MIVSSIRIKLRRILPSSNGDAEAYAVAADPRRGLSLSLRGAKTVAHCREEITGPIIRALVIACSLPRSNRPCAERMGTVPLRLVDQILEHTGWNFSLKKSDLGDDNGHVAQRTSIHPA